MRGRTRLFLLLMAAAAGLSQSENEPYFALSTYRTFPSNGKPSVSFSAWNVPDLEFRVYRIEDPVKFFQQIEDPHQFGGRAPRPPHERTLLERIHIWKHDLRTSIRRSLRGQFTEPPSAHFEAILPREAKPVTGKGTHFAETPVLNSQQLVHTFMQPVRSHSRWEQATVEIPVKDKGVYLVEAVRGELRAYTVLMLSDVVMITKRGASRIVATVVDRSTGEPLRGVPISLLTAGSKLSEVTTDADGMAEIHPAEGAVDLRVVALRGRDVAVDTQSGAPFGANAEEWMGYIYTDRPVYRPGHTVHFKGILRLRTVQGYKAPAGRSVAVEIQDSEQKPVFQKTVTTSANGTLSGELELAPTAALGHYFIQVKSGESTWDGQFEVEEYKKPEYEVRVVPVKSRVLQGEAMQVVIDARYYFGEPVSGAKVTYAIYRDRYWFPAWYDPDDDSPDAAAGDGGDAGDADSGDQVGEQEGQLDADGKMTLSLPTTVSDQKADYQYRIEARVSDASNREITGKGWIVATYGSFAVHVAPDQYFYSPGSKGAFRVEARDYDNHPVRTRARVELYRWYPRQPERRDVLSAADVELGDTGSATAALNIPVQGGSYRVRMTARTPEGRDVEDESYIWVSGGTWESDTRSDHNIEIIPDKKTYRAGDTVKLLVVGGRPNTPLYISVEGRDLREYKLYRSRESTVSFELPVTAVDEPGLTVSADFIRNGVFHEGQKYIRVPPVEHQLNVKLATDKSQYLPGQTAQYTVDVTNAGGAPVAGAEFSLGVVDEAIYGIRRDTTQDILKFFFDRAWNRVYTETSLNYYFNGEAGKRRMRLADLRSPSRLAQLKPERLVQPKIRKAFPDTAFWTASLVTDSAGHARAAVEFPDSLTSWRATARGVTPDTRVGNAVLKTVVRKNLILRLSVPRFFVQGDEVVISALVHNYLATAKTARVSLDVKGLEVLEGATKDVEIASRGEAKIDWRVRATQVRAATITGKALTDEESDAVELELPVNVPGIKLSQARGGSVAPGGTAEFDLSFPSKVEPGSRSLSLRVSPSIAGSLFAAVEFLTSYPYGCVEQTMSSFLPNIVVQQAVRDLGLKVDLDQAGMQEKIRAGLERLYQFQHEDGGWGWWQTDESQAFMTAYVVAGLAQARGAGTAVNPESLQKGAAWLARYFTADPKLAGDLRAYMMYALASAGAPDAAGLGDVYSRRSNLSPYGLAILGLALEQAKDARAAEIADALTRGAQQDQEQAWWVANQDHLLGFAMDMTPEATAWAVKFLSHQHPESPLLPKAAFWLMNHRNEGYWWDSTKQTAMVIYGLTDYLKTTNELRPNLTATVFVNDRAVLTRKIDQATALNAPDLVLDESKLQPGANRIRVTMAGEGRLYYSVRAQYSSTEEKLEKAGSVSLNLLRDYFRLTPGRAGERIVYDTTPVTGPVAAGDILAVRLTVTGTEWKYLMIEDPIPAGTEFIERDTVYELRNRPPWWAYWFTRRELHDDRLAIFQTYFKPGQQQYFYLLKVVNPGKFQVSPARVGPMYQTDIMATSERRNLEVK